MTFWELALAVAVGIMIAEVVTLAVLGFINLFTDFIDF